MKKIALIVGARPQFIKVALLTPELSKKADAFIIHTGQHYDHELSGSFFELADIPAPRYNLQVGSGGHGAQTGEMLSKLEEVYQKEQPDMVVVVGDTNSTLAGALAATKLHIPIAHVEAGMRNFDRKKPEEVNRVLTDHITDLFFPPTENARQNLAEEGLTKNVHVVGDISNDLFIRNVELADERSEFLSEHELSSKEYYLLTIHKSINTDSTKRLEAILKTISCIDDRVIFPAHPRTSKSIENYGLGHYLDKENIKVIKPLTFFDMISAMKHARKIITDSGGIQKEALALRVPCLTMRKTEWVETLENEWNIEVDIHNGEQFLHLISEHLPVDEPSDFLGQGDTYQKISEIIWDSGMC